MGTRNGTLRTSERPVIAGNEGGRYYVNTNKGNVYSFDNATDAGVFFGSDLLSDLLIAEDEGAKIAVACERSALRAKRRDVYDAIAAGLSVFGAAIVLTVAAYYIYLPILGI